MREQKKLKKVLSYILSAFCIILSILVLFIQSTVLLISTWCVGKWIETTPTYYKVFWNEYDKDWIVGKSKDEIIARYGDFDVRYRTAWFCRRGGGRKEGSTITRSTDWDLLDYLICSVEFDESEIATNVEIKYVTFR